MKKQLTQKELRAKRRRRKKQFRILILCLGALAVVSVAGLCIWMLYKLGRSMWSTEAQQISSESEQFTEVARIDTDRRKEGTSSFTFTGVGDNLLHDTIFVYFEQDHGHRDFRELYENTRPYFQDTDFAYANFETVCAGDEYGLSGYPNFNGPTEMIDALADSGFDWFSVSSNHSLDAGVDGLQHEISYIHERFPDIATTGAFVSEEEAAAPLVREVNGIRVGLCGFTYGLNGYQLPDGYDWLIDVYKKDENTVDYDLMEKKLYELRQVSDVQMVAMHWGVEYQTTPTEEQKEVARFLNEHGVEVIIGTHPHVIEPVELIQTDEQTTLVYYSLGNFISAQDSDETMVGGMARFNLNYDFESGKTTFDQVQFIPTITYISPDLRTYRTLTIHEYNDEWAANHYITALGMDVSKQWVQDYVRSVVGSPEGIEIVLE